MSFFSWMRGARCESREPATSPQPACAVTTSPQEMKSKSTYITMDPSTIAELVIRLNDECSRAFEQCAEANAAIEQQRIELVSLKERNTHLEASNKKFQASNKTLNATIVTRNSTVNQKSAQLSQAQQLLEVEQERCKALRIEILESRIAVRKAQYSDLYDDINISSDAISMITQQADLRPMPFVVVLVDGDSYQFEDQIKSGGSNGPEIAQNLHREVSKYILSHPRIPPHSKIIARIFCNRSSLQGRLPTKPKPKPKPRVVAQAQPIPTPEADRRPSVLVEKMVKFAETYPLFDYLDCGGGKERVDDKIRENTHLYLADNNCHGVFLAVCNDNGYMRMLERYSNNPIPAAKIVLLTNGGITPEMARLSFPKVQLEAVFVNKYKKKIRQGTSGRIGPVLDASQFQGHQTSSDYDLDYTDPPIRDKMEKSLNQMRYEKQQSTAMSSVFMRLPYEANEEYEARMSELMPSARAGRLLRKPCCRLVSYVGLRKSRPRGVLSTAPILPFLLYSEVVQSTNALDVRRKGAGSWTLEEGPEIDDCVLD